MLHDTLRNKFGFENFKPEQQEVIESIISQRHTLDTLSTGGGKSLCYQVPTYLSGKPVLIISPLISLMDDQVMQSEINGEKCVTCIHSDTDGIKKKHNIECLRYSRFIFPSSESLLQPSDFKLVSMINFGMTVLDEAHCLSEWGYDFRPHYALTGKVAKHFKEAVVLVLTATAPPHLQDDLTEMLEIQFNTIETTMDRPNASFKHLSFHNDEDKIEWLLPFLQQSGPTITYVSSKKMCLSLARLIYGSGFLTGICHGDMSCQERYTVQQQFLNNDIPITVATSAFDMGINKKDIRTIIHFHLSTSPSNYIQEIGCAGHDGGLSQTISLFQPDNKYILETLLFADMITEEDVQNFRVGEFLAPDKQDVLTALHSLYSIDALKQVLKKSLKRKQLGFFRMVGHCELDQYRRKYLLKFFGEYPPAQDQCCDNDSNIADIAILNKKEAIRSIGLDEKLQNLFLR